MTIGEKIKYARNLRGFTQKELGLKLGFDEKSADVRIAQYESGTRTPKADLLSEIANLLDVNISFLKNPSLENTETFIHLLFDLEQESKKHHTNNFSIISVSDELGNPQPAIQFHNHLLNEFLSEWQIRRKELNEKIITEEEYAEWMMNFPATSDNCGNIDPIKKWRK
ncbi:MAG: helix-turn-helix transcriptional regulator [Oscillospiraceae bacterium]|nr:helix-turn-helix transcriptional regulator [Oscillospiraceae bacterium]